MIKSLLKLIGFHNIRAAITKPAPAISAESNYDSANYSNRRSRVPGPDPTDAKFEYEEHERLEVTKKTRYLAINSGLMKEVVDNHRTYGVGDGIKPQPVTSNRAAAKLMRDAFSEWGKRADITGRFSMRGVTRACSRALDVDGEIFVILTQHPITLQPSLQMIEAHRVGDFGKDDTTDGIKFNAWGEPVFYRVLLDNGTTQDVPAGRVLHVFDPDCPSTVRQAPAIQHGALHMLDESELLALEKSTAKDHADIARVLTREGGTLDETGDFSPLSEEDNEGTDPVKLQRILGGKLVALSNGEKMESFKSDRPSAAFTGFIEHLRRDATLGTLPYEFSADPGSLGSAAVRLVTAKAGRRFGDRQSILIEKLIEPVWFFVIGTKINRGELKPLPAWWVISCLTPRSITVDAGREAAQNRADVEMGLKTFSDHFGELGMDFEEEMDRRGQDLALMGEIAKKYSIPIDLLYRTTRPLGGESPDAKPTK